MRTPQRNFVVEFKSGRRRPTTPPGSIWNDTDLREIVRKAEVDAPHLFEPSEVSEATWTVGQVPPNSEPRPSSDIEAEIDSDPLNSVSPVESAFPNQHVSDLADSDTVRWTAVSLDRQPEETRKRQRKANAQPDFAVERRAATKRSILAKVESPYEELTSLDEENRQLKALLARHLQNQNRQLREMLERFYLSEHRGREGR